MSSSQAQGGTGTGVRTRATDALRTWPAVIILLGALCVVVLFFAWNWLCLPAGGGSLCTSAIGVVSGWSGFGVAAGLAAGCLVLWEAVSVAGALVLAGPDTERLVAAGLGLAAVVFAGLRVLTRHSGLTPYAWLGLALSACLFAVAAVRWLSCRRAERPATS